MRFQVVIAMFAAPALLGGCVTYQAYSGAKLEPTEVAVLSLPSAGMQVTIDGEELPGELLEVDDEREWKAQYTIYMICGNAGGVELTVNGEELGLLGERAQVVEKIWGPEGEIAPTPGAESATPTPAG